MTAKSFLSKTIQLGTRVTFWFFVPENPDVDFPTSRQTRTGIVVCKFLPGRGLCIEDQGDRVWVCEDQVLEVHDERN